MCACGFNLFYFTNVPNKKQNKTQYIYSIIDWHIGFVVFLFSTVFQKNKRKFVGYTKICHVILYKIQLFEDYMII